MNYRILDIISVYIVIPSIMWIVKSRYDKWQNNRQRIQELTDSLNELRVDYYDVTDEVITGMVKKIKIKLYPVENILPDNLGMDIGSLLQEVNLFKAKQNQVNVENEYLEALRKCRDSINNKNTSEESSEDQQFILTKERELSKLNIRLNRFEEKYIESLKLMFEQYDLINIRFMSLSKALECLPEGFWAVVKGLPDRVDSSLDSN